MKIPMKTLACGLMTIVFLTTCSQKTEVQYTKSGLARQDFQTVVNGKSTDLYVIRNANGMEVCITNYGGRVVSLMVPDATGSYRDVVQGFAHIEGYTSEPSSFGATMGRFANRINNGRFILGSDTVQLDRNDGQHTIHGGGDGWRGQVFAADQSDDSTLVLTYVSPDGESGFPGEVAASVTFSVNQRNELAINYQARTTKKTVINLTNHSFFNLSGNLGETVLDDTLYVNATQYTPLDSTLITTGEIIPVVGTPFDFTEPVSIRDALAREPANAQLQIASGIDHNLVLNTGGSIDELAARLYAPTSGIVMEVYTDEPGLQVYTGNMLDGSRTGKGNVPYSKQTAVCLETQHFPDAPNKPHWPTTVLEPGERYTGTCIYRFSVVR